MSPKRRALTWVALVVFGVVVVVLLLATGGLIAQAASSKALPRGESRTGDVIGAAVCFVVAALSGFWMFRAGRRFRVRGQGADFGSMSLQQYTTARLDRHQVGDDGSQRQFGFGGRRRSRRGKALSEMNAAEVRRATWLLPLSMGTAVIAGAGRIAVAVIEHELPLGLAGVLIAAFIVWPIAVTIRMRRRYRARLSELRDPITGALPTDPPAPLPLATRVWLLASPLLVVIGIALIAVLPGTRDTCVSKGIATAAAREGICQRGGNLFGGGVTYNVINAGHTLTMPGYQARLLSSSLAPVTADGPNATAALYPDHQGLLVSFEIEVTNDSHGSLQLPVTQGIAAEIPASPGSEEGNQWWPSVGATSAPAPQLAAEAPLAPEQSNIGWVSFVLPPSIEPLLRARLSDLEFYPADQDHSYVGQIRLWKAANAAGNTALQFRSQP